MPGRVADAIEQIARPNRDDQQEKPQIQADPALRRPRLIRNTPIAVVAVIVVACAVAAGWAGCSALGLPAVPGRPALSIAGTAARPRGGGSCSRRRHRWFARVGIPAHPDLATRSADMGHGRAPSQPADSVDRIAGRGSGHRGRAHRGRVGDVDRQRCRLRARGTRQRYRRGQGGLARDRGRSDRGRSGNNGVATPKGRGASAIREAIRRVVYPVGRFGHGGAHRRCVRDGRCRR